MDCQQRVFNHRSLLGYTFSRPLYSRVMQSLPLDARDGAVHAELLTSFSFFPPLTRRPCIHSSNSTQPLVHRHCPATHSFVLPRKLLLTRAHSPNFSTIAHEVILFGSVTKHWQFSTSPVRLRASHALFRCNWRQWILFFAFFSPLIREGNYREKTLNH